MQTAGHSTQQNTRRRWACLLFWLANRIPEVCGLVVTASSSQLANVLQTLARGTLWSLPEEDFTNSLPPNILLY